MREFQLLQHVYGFNANLPSRVTIPPGDDMGAVRIGDAQALVTVDQVADGVHFDLRTHTLRRIGRKAVTRNLSDVAAMAAKPVGAVVAGCLPRDFGEARANELFDAMRDAAEHYHCPLIGGDIAMWDHPLILTVTVLAEPAGIEPVLRRGARVGDIICVTGSLGGSIVELEGVAHHLDFEPRIDLARKLAGHPTTRPHCMIDLSDGLARDLNHLCDAAGVSAVVYERDLPVSQAAHHASKNSGRPAWRHAVGDGEDYELCFTVAADRAERLPVMIEGTPITRIGVITAGSGGARIELNDASTHALSDLGWEHHGS